MDTVSRSRIGLHTTPVVQMAVTDTLRAPAFIVADEERISRVHTKVSGWIEDLRIASTGQKVTKGEPLLTLYSREFLATQAEYLSTRPRSPGAGNSSVLAAAARQRLLAFGMTDDEIRTLERTGEPRKYVTLVVPRTGTVLRRGVVAGMSVNPSTELLTIADLTILRVEAELPAALAAGLETGMPATLEVEGHDGPPLNLTVGFITPVVTGTTRTVTVRLELDNHEGWFRPGEYGTVTLAVAGTMRLVVPRESVVDTGLSRHVFVQTTADRFEPRAVGTGVRTADQVEITSGLAAGERVVSAGVFLLDSESRMRATGGGHAGHGKPDARETNGPAPGSHGSHGG